MFLVFGIAVRIQLKYYTRVSTECCTDIPKFLAVEQAELGGVIVKAGVTWLRGIDSWSNEHDHAWLVRNIAWLKLIDLV